MKPKTTTIGAAIRMAAQAGGLNQRELADALSTTPPTVTRWVKDQALPPLERLTAIEDACGVQRGFILRAAGAVADLPDTPTAIQTDPHLSEGYRRMLTELYHLMVRNGLAPP